jgi:hypothetical protein
MIPTEDSGMQGAAILKYCKLSKKVVLSCFLLFRKLSKE